MFLGRFNHFVCDKCDKEEHLQHYGLPKGWIYITQLDGPPKHFCDECERKRKEKNNVNPFEIKTKKTC
jgi:hypothetical protein